MNRLDDTVGPENWWDEYTPLEHSVICRLTIRLPDGTTLTKSDAGGHAGMSDPGDDEKSGFADAFKRAAVKFGIGRYLYKDGVPDFAQAFFQNYEEPRQQATPQQHSSAPPARQESRGAAPAAPSGRSSGGGNYDPNAAPRSGRALFAWCKKAQENDGEDWVKRVNELGDAEGLPKKMIDWSETDVARIFGLVTGTANHTPAPAATAPSGAKRPSSMVADDDIPY